MIYINFTIVDRYPLEINIVSGGGISNSKLDINLFRSLEDFNTLLHTTGYAPPPPVYLPSIDKKYFIDGWFLFCLEIWIYTD